MCKDSYARCTQYSQLMYALILYQYDVLALSKTKGLQLQKSMLTVKGLCKRSAVERVGAYLQMYKNTFHCAHC